jgi:hypothetical protein
MKDVILEEQQLQSLVNYQILVILASRIKRSLARQLSDASPDAISAILSLDNLHMVSISGQCEIIDAPS